MGLTKKKKYDRYTLAFKQQIVKLANHPRVKAKDVADTLGLHPVMVYRWQMEGRNGELKGNKHMKRQPPPSTKPKGKSAKEKSLEFKLKESERKIRQLEKQLKLREEDIDILKKAERFFEKNRK